MDQAAAHVLRPNAIGDGTREVGVVGGDQPVRQLLLARELGFGQRLLAVELGLLEILGHGGLVEFGAAKESGPNRFTLLSRFLLLDRAGEKHLAGALFAQYELLLGAAARAVNHDQPDKE